MNHERLEHTLKLLRDEVSRKEFYIGAWRVNQLPDGGCGTAACAFGHEALSEYGAENGLGWSAGAYVPTYNDKSGYFAAAEYYDIPLPLALHLFSPEAYTNDGDQFYDAFGRTGSYPCVKEANGYGGVKPEHVVKRLENVLGLCKKEAGSQSAVK